VKAFEYANPTTIKDAVEAFGAQWSDAEVFAGGTDILALMKDFIVTPKRLVDIKAIKELGGVQIQSNALRLGSTATMEDIVRSRDAASRFRAIHQAADGIPSPQIRNRGTVGGDLAQRNRCWYFRLGYGQFGMKDGKSLIPAGENKYHAIFGNTGPAYFVSPSSLGPALVAMDAEITVQSKTGARKIKAADFFVIPKTEAERETVLKPGDIITEIRVPAGPATTSTYEVRQKTHLDWPLVAASVVLNISGGTVRSAKVVLGHVAPTPWRATAAETAIVGKAVNEQTAAAAGEAAVRGAAPLSQNGYKVQLAKVAVKRAILAAARV
jgi:xanthine dehydrogenase YagS FAD-binding subunit